LGGRWNDLELVTLTPALGSYFGATEGLLVVRVPDEPSIGLQDGDVILDIAGREPTSPEHAMRILMSFEPGETITFSVMRRQRRESIEYRVPGASSDL
jgi:S1-C subfamily serine protease